MEIQKKLIKFDEDPVQCEAKGCEHTAIQTNIYRNLNLCMGHHQLLQRGVSE